MNQNLNLLAERVLSAAKKAGAQDADVLISDAQAMSIEVHGGALEHMERSETLEIGLRVLIGKKQASIAISDASEDAIEVMADRACQMAQVAPEDPSVGLGDPDQMIVDFDAEALELYDPSDALSPAQLEDMAQSAEAAALAVEGVTRTQGAGVGQSKSRIILATTNGFSGSYRRSGISTSIAAIAGDGLGMERDFAGEARVYRSDLPAAEEIGALAGARAVARLHAKNPPTGTYPVFFDERVSATLIGHILSAINGSAILRGTSWLKDQMDQQILPSGLDLIEDPHRLRISGSRPFDGEGIPTQKRKFIEDGVLRSWVLDLATARKLNLATTGNAYRSTSLPPSPAVGNATLTSGDRTKEALLSDMGTGLWVTSMIGSTINSNTGDYSRGVSGFWVENGEAQYPVNGGTIAGNLLDMCKKMIPANDGRWHLSRVVPSLLIDGMALAGK